MFDKHRLLNDGVEGQAVVTAIDTRSAGASTFRTKLEMTFRCEDGTTVNLSAHVLDHEVGDIVAGNIVPVRYDASNHRKVVLDLPALKTRYAATLAAETEKQKAAIARSQAQIAQSGTARTQRTDPAI